MWWRYHLIKSADLSHIGELKAASSKTLQLVHNRAGTAGFDYPLDEPLLAHRIEPWKTGIIACRYNWRASRLAGRGVWDDIWSGYVLPMNRDVTGGKKNVTCIGWLNRMETRFFRDTKNHPYVEGVSTDDGDIILDIVDEMNNNPAADGYTFTPMAGSSSLTLMTSGSKLPNEGVGGATAYVPAYRGMSYDEDQQALQAMIDLIDVENGVDITVHPRTRVLDVYRKYMRDLPELQFGYNRHPRNIQVLGNPVESEKTVNYFKARGSSLSVPRYQDDHDSMAEFGPIEEIVTLADVVDSADDEAGSVLQHYASTEVLFRAFPPQTFQITPFAYTPDNSVPEPFVDYRIGDRPRLSAKRGKEVDLKNHPIRIFGMTVNIDDEGNEKLQALQVTP